MSFPFIDGLSQDWSNSVANALELLQLCATPSIYRFIEGVFIQYTIILSNVFT